MKLAAIFVSLLVGVYPALAESKKKKEPTLSPIDEYIKESTQRAVTATPGSPGSIWAPGALLSGLGMDQRASRVDDIVMILVSEQANAVTTSGTQTSRQSSVKAGITGLVGIPHATGPLPNLAGANNDTELKGQGTTSRQTTLTTTMSTRVTNVLPNGNLVVQGTRNITVNSENQVITVRGVIRPIDLDTNNSVASSQIAQMEIRLNGKGVVNDAIRRPNILYRLLLGILPF
jgi:flagellar L-ring protein precursor FlgH